jgi:hypothetical protein
MAYQAGVICRSCRRGIEIEDEYIRGVRASEMAATLYDAIRKRVPDFLNSAWRKTLACGNPDCGKTHEYKCDDLLLYDG